MFSEEPAATLIARFLRSNNYPETLEAFLREANLPNDTGLATSNALTIEQVLKEKQTFDLSQQFERVDVRDDDQSWTSPAPSKAHEVLTISNPANILHVSVDSLQLEGSARQDVLLASGASKALSFLSNARPHQVMRSETLHNNSPILSWIIVRQRYLFAASMSGHVTLLDLRTMRELWSRRDHAKYVVTLAHHGDEEGFWLASAGWDARVLLYRFSFQALDEAASSHSMTVMAQPLAAITLPSNPEALLFITHPELEQPVILLSRRDSTFLYYHAIAHGLEERPPSGDTTDLKTLTSLPLLGRQNLAPHSNAWIAFTPSAFALHPLDSSLIGVATSHTPHMKFIVARLLLPPPTGDPYLTTSATAPPVLDATSGPIVNPTQASEARRLLAIQDREDAAIQLQMSTMAPQTAYSTPALAWRPDGTGVWVNGDDGVVRGVETKTGKVVAVLKGGHEPGSKVRCVWAGKVDDQEWVVSGGFDRRLVVWRCEDA